MEYEIRAYYKNSVLGNSLYDEECSTPRTIIDQEKARAYMALLEDMGAKRHETKTQIFFDQVEDNKHNKEYIFYK